MAMLAPILLGASDTQGEVTVTVTKLRSTKGQILACLTSDARAFPQCERDKNAQSLIVPAREGLVLNFGRVPAGRYAIALIHDENGNGKLDKNLIIPREGFGFSRNAPVAFGPPSFKSASFVIDGKDHQEAISVRYLF